jgi:hypothetical protein
MTAEIKNQEAIKLARNSGLEQNTAGVNTKEENDTGAEDFRSVLGRSQAASKPQEDINNQKLETSQEQKNNNINFAKLNEKNSRESVGTEVASRKLVAQVYARMLNEVFEEMEANFEGDEDATAGKNALQGHIREQMINKMFEHNSTDPVVKSLNKEAGGINGKGDREDN